MPSVLLAARCLNAGALGAVRTREFSSTTGSSSDKLPRRYLLSEQARDLLRRALEDKDITRARRQVRMSQTRPELEDAAAHARPQLILTAVIAFHGQNLLVGRDLGRAALALPRDLRRREAVGGRGGSGSASERRKAFVAGKYSSVGRSRREVLAISCGISCRGLRPSRVE